MKEKMNTVQLRSTIFLQQNIGYTPETAEKFRNLLMPGCKIYNIAQPGMPMLGVNPNMPQYGMPWRLFSKLDDGEYNIAFQLGKIDIILAKEVAYGDDTEKNFCDKSIKWFSDILETQGNAVATRIAYAPLYAIKNDGEDKILIWENLLKKTVFGGIPTQDVNLSFLLKSFIFLQGENVQINLLHNIFDGNQIKNEGTSQIVNKVLLLQLDLNTIPEKNLSLTKDGIADFFSNILETKSNLINNVTE